MSRWTKAKRDKVDEGLKRADEIMEAYALGKKKSPEQRLVVEQAHRDMADKYRVPAVRMMDDGMFEQFTGVARDRSSRDLQGKEIQLLIDIHNGKKNVIFKAGFNDDGWNDPENSDVALPYYQYLVNKYKIFCDSLKSLHNYLVGTKLIALERNIIQSFTEENLSKLKIRDRIELLKTINTITNNKPSTVNNNMYVISNTEEVDSARKRILDAITKDPNTLKMLEGVSSGDDIVDGEVNDE